MDRNLQRHSAVSMRQHGFLVKDLTGSNEVLIPESRQTSIEAFTIFLNPKIPPTVNTFH